MPRHIGGGGGVSVEFFFILSNSGKRCYPIAAKIFESRVKIEPEHSILICRNSTRPGCGWCSTAPTHQVGWWVGEVAQSMAYNTNCFICSKKIIIGFFVYYTTYLRKVFPLKTQDYAKWCNIAYLITIVSIDYTWELSNVNLADEKPN